MNGSRWMDILHFLLFFFHLPCQEASQCKFELYISHTHTHSRKKQVAKRAKVSVILTRDDRTQAVSAYALARLKDKVREKAKMLLECWVTEVWCELCKQTGCGKTRRTLYNENKWAVNSVNPSTVLWLDPHPLWNFSLHFSFLLNECMCEGAK